MAVNPGNVSYIQISVFFFFSVNRLHQPESFFGVVFQFSVELRCLFSLLSYLLIESNPHYLPKIVRCSTVPTGHKRKEVWTASCLCEDRLRSDGIYRYTCYSMTFNPHRMWKLHVAFLYLNKREHQTFCRQAVIVSGRFSMPKKQGHSLFHYAVWLRSELPNNQKYWKNR